MITFNPFTGTFDITGVDGTNGWTPRLSVVADGARRVLQVNWIGGTGTMPAGDGYYVAAAGLDPDIADGVDIRGPAGVGGGGSGNVVGPVASTDNAIALFDGTTGELLQDGPLLTAGGNGAADQNKVPQLNAYGGLNLGDPAVVNGANNVLQVDGTTGFSIAATTVSGTAIDGSPSGAGGGFQSHLGALGTYGFMVDGTVASITSFAFGAFTTGQVLSAADETTAESLAIFGDGRIFHRDRSAGFAIQIPEPILTANRNISWPDASGIVALNGVIPISIKTTTYVVTTADAYIVGNHAATPFTITLLDATTNLGRTFKFKNKGAAAVTLDATGLGQIFTSAAANTLVLNTGDMYTLTSDGVTWVAGD